MLWIINLQCGIFCHLEEAFDCVDHNILLSTLQYYGITGSMCTLIQSYLTGRYQYVVTVKYQIITYVLSGV